LISTEPTPDFAAAVAEEYDRLLALLGNPQLVAVAVAKMEGFTIDEVAARLDCAPRTIERRLGLIRQLWNSELRR
jgi:DNA-directed RNA polymerase specialized sigma24 family protein